MEKSQISYKDYLIAFQNFFTKSNIPFRNCEFIIPKLTSKPSIIVLCLDISSDDIEGFSLMQKSINAGYAYAIRVSDLNSITPLQLHEEHKVQFFSEGNTFDYYMLMNEHGVVFSTENV